MMRTFALGLALLAILPASGSHSATQVDCHAMFRKIDVNGDGRVGGPELIPFLPSLLASGFPAESVEGAVFKAREFEQDCMRDRFKDVPPPQ